MKESTSLIIDGTPYQLVWDKASMYRADECGVFTTKGIGFARAAKYVWAMVPDELRRKYPSPEAIARVLPPVNVVWVAVDAAIKAGGEGMSPKNVFGSTNGRSPSSS